MDSAPRALFEISAGLLETEERREVERMRVRRKVYALILSKIFFDVKKEKV